MRSGMLPPSRKTSTVEQDKINVQQMCLESLSICYLNGLDTGLTPCVTAHGNFVSTHHRAYTYPNNLRDVT